MDKFARVVVDAIKNARSMDDVATNSAQAPTRQKWIFIVCLAVGLVALFWIVQCRIGLWMGDEGHLLYSSWRVGQGEIPIRDFRCYEPGRYYWVALWSSLFGFDIVGQRVGIALFQITGLACGLFAAHRVARRYWSLFLVGVLLSVWTWPRFRVFESAVSMAAVLVGTRLIEKPNAARLWTAGIFVGLSAFVGRNLGLYGLIAFPSILLLLRWQRKIQLLPALARLAGGIVVGYTPMFVLMLAYRGFFRSFAGSILADLRRGETNKSLPIPWPWNATLASDWIEGAHQVFTGVGFVMLLVVLAVSLLMIFSRPKKNFISTPLLGAAAVIGLVYAHHALVRSDLSHLTSVIHPVLLGSLCLIGGLKIRGRNAMAIGAAVALSIVTAFAPLYQQPFIQKLLYPDQFALVDVRGDSLWLSKSQASLIAAVRSTVERDLAEDDLVFFAPYSPGMYVVLGRRSPTWDEYPLLPAPPEWRRRMIEELERTRPKYAFVSDLPLDGDDAWRFRNTHPEVWALLQTDYVTVEDKSFPADYFVFRLRQTPEQPIMSSPVATASHTAPRRF